MLNYNFMICIAFVVWNLGWFPTKMVENFYNCLSRWQMKFLRICFRSFSGGLTFFWREGWGRGTDWPGVKRGTGIRFTPCRQIQFKCTVGKVKQQNWTTREEYQGLVIVHKICVYFKTNIGHELYFTTCLPSFYEVVTQFSQFSQFFLTKFESCTCLITLASTHSSPSKVA